MTLALTLLSTGTKHERSLHKRLTQVKYYALLATALAACTQQRPVVLAPVRMEIPPADSSAPARHRFLSLIRSGTILSRRPTASIGPDQIGTGHPPVLPDLTTGSSGRIIRSQRPSIQVRPSSQDRSRSGTGTTLPTPCATYGFRPTRISTARAARVRRSFPPTRGGACADFRAVTFSPTCV